MVTFVFSGIIKKLPVADNIILVVKLGDSEKRALLSREVETHAQLLTKNCICLPKWLL